VVGTSKDPNAKVTVLLTESGDRPALAVKAPTTAGAARAVLAEADVLDGIESLALPALLETVPRVVEVADFEGWPALVTTALAGTPMSTRYLRWRHTARPARVAADFAAVGRWLAALQTQTGGPRARLSILEGVEPALRGRYAGDAGLADDLAALSAIHGRLRGQHTPRTVVHGDLWVGNVLCTGDRVSGVVDWESAALAGEPTRDLVRFPLMYALYLDRRTRPGRRVAGHPGLRATGWGAGVEYALDGSGWFPDLVRDFIMAGLARLGAGPGCWRDAALAGIAEAAAFTDDQGFGRDLLGLFRRVAHGGRHGRRRT
jgi:aminoglycoside phosphotransferase (APT) family kinase protein